jgi:hypothetical protein
MHVVADARRRGRREREAAEHKIIHDVLELQVGRGALHRRDGAE